jgi:hypothetical protein
VIDTGKYERLREYLMENGRSTPAGLFNVESHEVCVGD